MRRLEVVEFLKGYSIFTIIIFHYLQRLNFPYPFDQLIFFGGTGVHLFILLSGFGLYLSYLNKPLPYTGFIKKRIAKVYVPYLAVVVISALISLFIPIYENSLYALGGHILLYKMFDESIVGSYGYPLWFISTVLQFYILFHILVYIAKKLTDVQFLALCLSLSLTWTFLVLSIGKESERVWNSFFLQYLWEFALGMVIASKVKENNYQLSFRPKPVLFLIVGILACGLFALLALKGGKIGKMFNDIPALIGYSSIALCVYLLRIDIVNRFFILTGKVSYALYLVHFLILLLALYTLRAMPVPVAIAIALLATYGTSLLYQKARMVTRKRSLSPEV